MPDSEIRLTADALIKAYGTDAVAMAKKGADNMRRVDMPERVIWWERVIAAVEAIQAEGSNR